VVSRASGSALANARLSSNGWFSLQNEATVPAFQVSLNCRRFALSHTGQGWLMISLVASLWIADTRGLPRFAPQGPVTSLDNVSTALGHRPIVKSGLQRFEWMWTRSISRSLPVVGIPRPICPNGCRIEDTVRSTVCFEWYLLFYCFTIAIYLVVDGCSALGTIGPPIGLHDLTTRSRRDHVASPSSQGPPCSFAPNGRVP
jgi:hypothetical protein